MVDRFLREVELIDATGVFPHQLGDLDEHGRVVLLVNVVNEVLQRVLLAMFELFLLLLVQWLGLVE